MLEDLDLVEEEDQFTHLLTLEDAGDPENLLSMLIMVIELFQDHPSVLEDLDLVEEADQFTHLLTLEDAGDPENLLSMLTIVFEFVSGSPISA